MLSKEIAAKKSTRALSAFCAAGRLEPRIIRPHEIGRLCVRRKRNSHWISSIRKMIPVPSATDAIKIFDCALFFKAEQMFGISPPTVSLETGRLI